MAVLSSLLHPGFDVFSVPAQGLPSRDPFVLDRRSLVDKICEALTAHNSVRVCAPPGSGKSSLCQLTVARLRELAPARPVIKISCVGFERFEGSYATMLQDFFKLLNINDLSGLTGCTLLLDDGLRIFQSGVGLYLIKSALEFSFKIAFFNAFYTSTSAGVSPTVDVRVSFTVPPCHCRRSFTCLMPAWLQRCSSGSR